MVNIEIESKINDWRIENENDYFHFGLLDTEIRDLIQDAYNAGGYNEANNAGDA